MVQVDLFSYRRVFVPVHVHGNHWCLGCVDMEARRIEYYDSLGGSNDQYFTTMTHYLADEHKAHHPTLPPLQPSEWTHHCPKHIPKQDNGSDCGVFTVKFADYLSHQPAASQDKQQQHHTSTSNSSNSGSSSSSSIADSTASALTVGGESQLDFSASDMEYFRNRIALEIKMQRVM